MAEGIFLACVQGWEMFCRQCEANPPASSVNASVLLRLDALLLSVKVLQYTEAVNDIFLCETVLLVAK